MKATIYFLFLVISTCNLYAQSTTDKVLNATGKEISAIHTDTKDAISALHNDAQAIVSTVYSDGKGVLGTIYSDANKIVKYAAPKLEAGLVAIAQTLKTTVEEVYRVLTLKHIASGISYLFILVLSIVFGYMSYRIVVMDNSKLLSSTPNLYGQYQWKTTWVILFCTASIMSLSTFIFFLANIQTAFVDLIAPQAGAIQDIINMVDTLIK